MFPLTNRIIITKIIYSSESYTLVSTFNMDLNSSFYKCSKSTPLPYTNITLCTLCSPCKGFQHHYICSLCTDCSGCVYTSVAWLGYHFGSNTGRRCKELFVYKKAPDLPAQSPDLHITLPPIRTVHEVSKKPANDAQRRASCSPTHTRVAVTLLDSHSVPSHM